MHVFWLSNSSSISSQIYSPYSISTNIVLSFFFFNLWSPIIVTNILLDVWPSIGTYLTHQGFYLKNNLTPSPLSLSIAPQLGVGCQSQVTPPHWDYCLNWTCLGLVDVVTVLVNSYVQLLYCSPEILFCCVLLLSSTTSASYSLSTSSSTMVLEL